MVPWVVVAGWIAGWVLAGPRPSRLPDRGAGGSVSVVIPARDEAARLPRLLAALALDPPDELVVVDDGSSDGTAAFAAATGATVLTSAPGAGSTGKSAACQRGAEAATADVVVFLDGDTEPAPGFVRRLAAAASSTGGLVSVQPHHRVERPYERLSATCALVAVLGAGTGARPVAFGPAVAVPRAPYLAAGGHTLAGAAVAEDLALAAALHERGFTVTAHLDDGRALRARMYPEGLRQLVDGWSKNLAAGAGSVPWWRSVLVGLWITGALVAVVAGPLAYALLVVQHLVLLRRVGRFGVVTALLWPLPLAAFVALFGRSLAHRLSGRPLLWRGREVRA